MKFRTVFIFALLVLALLGMVTPTLAATGTFSGSLDTSDPLFERTNDAACTTLQGSSSFYHDVYTFSVDVSGAYTLETTSAFLTPAGTDDDTFIILYGGSFNPASALTNCIAEDDDGGTGLLSKIQINLTAGASYVLVVTAYDQFDTGAYTGQISGPGNILFYGTDSFNPGDSRLNRAGLDRAAPVTVYCEEDGIMILNVDPVTGKGVDPAAINISYDEIDAVGVPTDSNVLLAQGRGVSLYRLTTGEFQVNTLYLNEFKWYIFVWDACPATKSYHLSS